MIIRGAVLIPRPWFLLGAHSCQDKVHRQCCVIYDHMDHEFEGAHRRQPSPRLRLHAPSLAGTVGTSMSRVDADKAELEQATPLTRF